MRHFLFLYHILTVIISVASISLLFSIYLKIKEKLLKIYIFYFSLITLTLFCGIIIIYFALNLPDNHKPLVMIFGGIIATFAFSIFFIFQMNYFIYVYFRTFEKNLKTINILLLSAIIAGTVYVILFIPNVHNKRTILFTNIALLNLIELIFGFYNIINWKNLKTRIEKKSLQKYALIISVLFAILPFLFFFNLLILNKDMYREIRPLFTITILNIWSILNIYYSIKYFRSSYSKEAKTVSEDFIKNFSITEREKNIIELVNKGLSNKEIADKLNLSLNTVKSYMYNIFQKTQIKSRTALIHLSKKP